MYYIIQFYILSSFLALKTLLVKFNMIDILRWSLHYSYRISYNKVLQNI